MKNNIVGQSSNIYSGIKTKRGHVVNVDSRPEFMVNDKGASPNELVLMGVAGCGKC
jgi:putative redox protein